MVFTRVLCSCIASKYRRLVGLHHPVGKDARLLKPETVYNLQRNRVTQVRILVGVRHFLLIFMLYATAQPISHPSMAYTDHWTLTTSVRRVVTHAGH
jgi:hypothetical protein